MRLPRIIFGLALLGLALLSCAPSGPSTSEILDLLETEVNEEDLEGTMALFAEDALWDESFKDTTCDGYENIEWCWEIYFMTPVKNEFREIIVDGDTATFTWVQLTSSIKRYWPAIIEVQNGKITLMEFPEEAVRESVDLE